MTDQTMLKIMAEDERLEFRRAYPAKFPSYYHVLAGADNLQFIFSIPTLVPAYEHVLVVPLSASVWIVDTVCSLLQPSAIGGVPDDVFAINLDRDDAPLRLRRSMQIGGPGEQGFTLFHRGMREAHGVGFLSTAWSDRLLFDDGLFLCLVRIANEWAKAHGQPGPRPAVGTIRPNWMGRSPAETPPPSED